MNSLDDWQARWYDWLERRSQKVTLGYSIRRCNEDEIEIHASIFDGLVRGYIRGVLFAIMLVHMVMTSHDGVPPFFDLKRDYVRAFDLDSVIKPMYEEYEDMRIRALTDNDMIFLEKKPMRNTRPLTLNVINGKN